MQSGDLAQLCEIVLWVEEAWSLRGNRLQITKWPHKAAGARNGAKLGSK